MNDSKAYEFWFITGSQHLYGQDTLDKVAEHSMEMARALDLEHSIPGRVVYKPTVKTPDEISKLCEEANSAQSCAGIITWMHTFSPAKMWIAALSNLRKPLLHLHTQYNRDIPWSSIDMDFMNLNQSAHGDREYGFIGTRLRLARKVVAGYWQDPEVLHRVAVWMRAAIGYAESRRLKIARFGDNMRQVAVTEGDKVEAQIKLGWAVDGYGIGDLVRLVHEVSDQEANRLLEEYSECYIMPDEARSEGNIREAVRVQAKIELALKAFLKEGGYGAFTTTFEDLHGLKQLPGLAVQRMMEAGYGFGGEGDWKTSAMVRLVKLMGSGLDKGTSFMEDYTYHMEPGNEMVLGAHMLEVCPSISAEKARIEVHPLGIGGKADPARLVFKGKSGPAMNASLIDMGDRFRLIINSVDAVNQEKDMPNLPVARVLWKLQPSFQDATEAWILACGAHHTVFSYDITEEHMVDWAEMNGIEVLLINRDTKMQDFKRELLWNDMIWRLR
ncbi:MAG: L-arabinose isomerase [Clostridiaceae bacterium]|nr:L-arabinose isomerase [Clostridiaceae bacterium]